MIMISFMATLQSLMLEHGTGGTVCMSKSFVAKHYIVARVPCVIFLHHEKLEMAAFYISEKSNHQFHIPVMAIGDTDPVNNTKDTFQFYPGKTASQQLSKSAEHVMISCTALGQMDHRNEEK